MAEHVADCTYERIAPDSDWYYVLIPDRQIVGQVWKTKRGYLGQCANTPKTILGPAETKELLGPQIVGKWEAFPVKG